MIALADRAGSLEQSDEIDGMTRFQIDMAHSPDGRNRCSVSHRSRRSHHR
jgi:hypothetical protein